MSGARPEVSVVRAGAAVVDVTPAMGARMSGFAARTSPSTGVHDPITVRALCVDDTALITVDVVGLHEDFCAAVARASALPAAKVRVHATHTHGGPASVPGRLGDEPDPAWLADLERACVTAVGSALRDQRPARVLSGYGAEVAVAHNRRRPDGPVDRSLPVVQVVDEAGRPIAVLVSYACHPVVLGADNTLLTADYPGVVRRHLEQRFPGAVALFLTGCAGDANTGHAASASVSLQSGATRTFAAAEDAGRDLAEAAVAVRLHPSDGPVSATVAEVELPLDSDPQTAPDPSPPARTGTGTTGRAGAGGPARWRALATDPATDPATAALMRCWADWADWAAQPAVAAQRTWRGRVGVLRWGGVRIVTLPGEPFARTGLDLRAALDRDPGVTVVAGYTDGCPGYLPTSCEYAHGGYEVAEAHRYYGMPGPFASGSAERLAATALRLAGG